MADPKDSKTWIEWLSFGCLITGAVIISILVIRLIAHGYCFWGAYGSDEVDMSAKTGDFVGGVVGSFWSLAGVLLFYSALRLQSKELSNQIEELRTTRETSQLQQFENSFYQLLSFHNDITSSITTTYGDSKERDTIVGRPSFKMYYKELSDYFNESKKLLPAGSELERIDDAYGRFFLKHQEGLGHYFRNLYQVVNLIHSSQCINLDKRFYVGIVRAQLSSFEHLMLFYNCLSKYGNKKFYPLVNDYALLDNMPVEQLLNIKHAQEYDRKAFGNYDTYNIDALFPATTE